MLWMCLMAGACLTYGGLYAVFTQKKSGLKAALGMWCLCLVQAGCLSVLLYCAMGQ